MKDFTTTQYISPILEEIKSTYTAATDDITTHYFKCSLVLKHPITRECYPVKAENDFYIPNLRSYKDIVKKINAYTAAAETYPEELNTWNYREKTRVFYAVRDALIKEYIQE